MNPADEMAAKRDAAIGDNLGKQLSAVLDEDEPVERNDLRPGFTSYLDQEASERKAIYDRLVAIEKGLKRRSSRGFARYLVAILIGVAATLAWQSYGEAAKQMIATSAPELGWSPEAKQMIGGWVQQLGWTKPPKQAAPVAQTAPAAPSLDPEQMQRMGRDVAAMRETVQELAAGQNQTARDIAKLESAVVEILMKMPEPPPQPPAAPARKPTVPPPSSRPPIPPHLPPHP